MAVLPSRRSHSCDLAKQRSSGAFTAPNANWGASASSLAVAGGLITPADIRSGNIDHALIGPGGIFAIETKTISKPQSGKCEVSYDGNRVLVNGRAPDRDPIVQAKACARQLREMLADYVRDNDLLSSNAKEGAR